MILGGVCTDYRLSLGEFRFIRHIVRSYMLAEARRINFFLNLLIAKKNCKFSGKNAKLKFYDIFSIDFMMQ